MSLPFNLFTQPTSELIKKRYSCRTYSGEPITPEIQTKLNSFIKRLHSGPFGSRPRFDFVASTSGDSKELAGLGTYGFIKNPPGFIIGATNPGARNLEDFGYLMEAIILYATDLGLGTCWLGGTFSRSTFASRIKITENEVIPAVTSVGYPASKPRSIDARIRHTAKADHRLPWERLFFDHKMAQHLTPAQAGMFAEPLELVRLGPSASNKQPWRIVKGKNSWDFYLCRTPGYINRGLVKIVNLQDLQRVDMGIAMCHFELTSKMLDLKGYWQVQENPQLLPDKDYLVSWVY